MFWPTFSWRLFAMFWLAGSLDRWTVLAAEAEEEEVASLSKLRQAKWAKIDPSVN